MNNENCKYMYVAEAHPCKLLIGKLLYCEKLNGKSFVAKLISIKGEMLVFQCKNGKIILDSFDSLCHISEYEEHCEPAKEAA